jgi:hypothetical protein
MPSEAQLSYLEKLKNPQWQKLRLLVLSRDSFTCQLCYDTKSTLHVHHRKYESGKDPWEYEPESLLTLCESCHGLQKLCKILCEINQSELKKVIVENFIGIAQEVKSRQHLLKCRS